ncbi:TonB-dependent receptor plug domain-containing protein [Chrysiogenes arsenatis]|uniref:TonB-dependent receptor plug domain-containing protein n=1 Tax=Chrysiogenes arsenatis TaxID=309797 RepID=UPI00040D9BBA|nr:TonB-dependent receptor [Chrysiogenes arsenatis]
MKTHTHIHTLSARSRFRLRAALAVAAASLLIVPHGVAHATTSDTIEHFLSMSLEDLMQVQVSALAKKPQSLQQMPASAYVLGREDIKRSGATNIPDLLRLIPGVHVAAQNAHTWAISIRGQSDVYSNRLLVMVDGRTVYSWPISGTYWHSVDVPILAIDRIEVVRGPGGAIWGANAVNGVINIVTKAANAEDGWQVFAGVGSLNKHVAETAFSDRIGVDGPAYRVYLKSRERGNFQDAYTDDGLQAQQAGFRVDGESGRLNYTVQGDMAAQQIHSERWVPLNTPYKENARSHNILGDVSLHDSNGTWRVKSYYDFFKAEVPVVSETKLFDIEATRLWHGSPKHEILMGVGARWTENTLQSGGGMSFQEPTEAAWLLSAFWQHEYRLTPALSFTYGAKVEQNDYIDETDLQPNVRVAWMPSDSTTFWGAASQAVRNPNRKDREMVLVVPLNMPPGEPPMDAHILGSLNLKTEKLTAYELGVRHRISEPWSIDVSVFEHRYKNSIENLVGMAVPDGSGGVIWRISTGNVDAYRTRGFEMSSEWAKENWIFQGGYSFLNISPDNEVNLWKRSPQHLGLLRVGYQPTDTITLDAWGRYYGKTKGFSPMDAILQTNIDPYWGLDLRAAWKVTPKVELALTGRDLLTPKHLEMESRGGWRLVGRTPQSVMATLSYQWD